MAEARPSPSDAAQPPVATGRRSWRDMVPSWGLSVFIHMFILVVLALITRAVSSEREMEVVLSLGVAEENMVAPAGGGASATGAQTNTAAANQSQTELPPAPTAAPAQSLPPSLPPLLPATDMADAFAPKDTGASLLSPGQVGGDGGDGSSGTGMLTGTSIGFQNLVRGMGRSGVDIVIVVDATDSMVPYIDQAKERSRQIIEVIEGVLQDAGDKRTRYMARFGVVAFKDYGDDYGITACRMSELTNEFDRVRGFIAKIVPSGGGDRPEPIHEALDAAMKMKWGRHRRKIIILVGDAPVHSTGRKRAILLATRFRRDGGVINIIDVGGVATKDTPARETVLPDFAGIANAGGGSAFLLTDEQQFWQNMIVSVFGREFQSDVSTIVERHTRDDE